jgi:hypothetical protein
MLRMQNLWLLVWPPSPWAEQLLSLSTAVKHGCHQQLHLLQDILQLLCIHSICLGDNERSGDL